MKSYRVLTTDIIELKGQHLFKFPGKTHYFGLGYLKLKAAQPVNYFPRFLGKNIKDYPPSKLFSFTSLVTILEKMKIILIFMDTKIVMLVY